MPRKLHPEAAAAAARLSVLSAVPKRRRRFSLFYPVALAAAAGMVVAALMPGIERARAWDRTLATISTRGVKITGEDLGGMVANEQAAYTIEDGVVTIESTGRPPIDDAVPLGVHYWLPADAVAKLAGLEVEARFEVRSPEQDGAEAWLVRIVAPGLFDTGWRPQRAEDAWSTAGLRFTLPAAEHYEPLEVVMWSDATGDGGRIELRSISFAPVAGGA